MNKIVFVYIWEYFVKEAFIEEFKSIYGSNGEWVKLFKKADGYKSTDLHQDIYDPKRFITVDIWDSKTSRDNFQHNFSSEFKKLDDRCENLTNSEKLIGDFNSTIG